METRLGRPSAFIGSSSEGKRFAIAVQAALQPDAEVTVWHQGVFSSGRTYIESLMAAPAQFDFAILVLTPDDAIQSRSTEVLGPRDNVIFELGLFMGKLGRDRTFILQQSGSGVKIPTDLSGVATGVYDWPRSDNNYDAAVAAASEAVRESIRSLGKRVKRSNTDMFAGLDATLVNETDGVLSARVSGCEIRALAGRIEDHPADPKTAVILPCNEYFDDECTRDTRSSLGAYVNKAFPGRVDDFVALLKSECGKRLGPGVERQMKEGKSAVSFGPGRAMILLSPLGSTVPLGLVSTTTQRAGQGLVAKTSYLFDGVSELVTRLVDERLSEVVMPVLGAGHGRIDPATALVSLLLALAEAARYAPGGRPLARVTIVIFQRDEKSKPQVDPIVVGRALALAASPLHVGSASAKAGG